MTYSIRNYLVKVLALTFVVLFLFACQQKADLIIHNATIYTLEDNQPKANSIVIEDGVIKDIGNDLLDKYSATSVVDAKSLPIYPGFIDSHSHFLSLGLQLNQLDLRGTQSVEEIQALTLEYKEANNSKYIVGFGWDQNDWENNAMPHKKILEENFSDIPVFLYRIDGHALWVNQKVLDLAAIDSNSIIEGGMIEVDEKGPTGILVDNAMDLVAPYVPVPTLKEKIEALTRAQEICFSFGLTTVTDAGLTKEDIFIIDSLQKNNLLEIRVYGMLKNEASTIDYFLEKGPLKTDRLNVRSIKLYADGALGSRGAALKSPYLDKKGHKGFFLTPIDSLEKFAYKIATTPFQLNTHAIGDAANNAVLNAYKKALVFKDDPRWRIEHAQVLDTNDISLFNRKIIPSVQPTHAVSDAPWAKERLGEERMHGAYAYKALLESAGRIALGTDFPVEDVNPINTFYAATYPPKSEEEIRSPKALEPREALYGMTKWAAEANFEEAEKGTLKIGKKADLVILDRDIIQASERRIPKTKVVATFLNGQIVFSRRYK